MTDLNENLKDVGKGKGLEFSELNHPNGLLFHLLSTDPETAGKMVDRCFADNATFQHPGEERQL